MAERIDLCGGFEMEVVANGEVAVLTRNNIFVAKFVAQVTSAEAQARTYAKTELAQEAKAEKEAAEKE